MTKTTTSPPYYAFDHERFRQWPEYREVAGALAGLAHRLDLEDDDLDLEGMEQMATAIIRHLRVSDGCCACADRGVVVSVTAHGMRFTGTGGVMGSYRCAAGHEWACYWGQP